MLRGERITLRALERDDLGRCHRWMNDEEVTKYLGAHDPLSMVEEERWFEKQSADELGLVLAIEDENGCHIGNIGLHDIDFRNGTAILGIVIGEKEMWGKGYGPETIHLLLRYAFDNLRLHRVGTQVFRENTRSLCCVTKCGFVMEGVRREVFFRDGEYHDAILFGLLAGEFDPERQDSILRDPEASKTPRVSE